MEAISPYPGVGGDTGRSTGHSHRRSGARRIRGDGKRTRMGLLTYGLEGGDVEVVTLHVEDEGQGIGRRLMDAVETKAVEVRARRLWLSTTNDNIRADQFLPAMGDGSRPADS